MVLALQREFTTKGFDMDSTTKWILGGVVTIAAFIISFVIRSQGIVDASQDLHRSNMSNTATEFRRVQRETNKQLYDDSKEIAETLRSVATTLLEVDERGSKALRVHERTRGEEVH
jgi:hypothetical protein